MSSAAMGRWHGVSMRSPQGNIENRGWSKEGAPEPWDRLGSAWSAIEPADPQYRVNTEVVKAIRRLDPDFVPLWLTTEHRSPSGAVVRCVHHAIAWRCRDPRKRHQDRQILWPVTRTHVNYGYDGFPMYVEEILQGPASPSGPTFLPLSWFDYERIKRGIWWQRHEMPTTPEEEARQEVERYEARKQKENERIIKELDYRMDHESKGVGRHLDQIGSADIQTWGAPREHNKPFVEVSK